MDSEAIRLALLSWYDDNARALPWRIPPREARSADPYRVWLSEVMLQQTTAAAVAPRFAAFLNRFPSVGALAAAPEADVMAAWAGLGYYARARNLHAAAKAIAAAGGFPGTEAGLLALPGVGAYTAAAIAAIAFGEASNPVDGNIERVMARLFALEQPLPAAKPALRALAQGFVKADRPGDWAQALMDLGAGVCRPKNPDCPNCPLGFACAARRTGDPAAYPRKRPKPQRPQRYGAAFAAFSNGRVLVMRRPAKGLLGAMLALPSTPWRAEPYSDAQACAEAPVDAEWRPCGVIRHVFTHFSLSLAVWRGCAAPAADGPWMDAHAAAAALPSVFRKALARALTDHP